MAVNPLGWVEPSPELTLAAEAGDTRAMVLLGRARLPDEERERWLRAAADAGDPDGMYELGNFHWDRHFSDPEAEQRARRWWVAAAEAGSVSGMVSVASLSTGAEQERWLRAAAEAGARRAPGWLGGLLEARDPAEAERWYRLAIERGDLGRRIDLADLLAGQGREAEAEELYRAEAERDDRVGLRRLIDLLSARGRQDEAARWRRRADEIGPEGMSSGHGSSLETVVATAAVTTALVPFLQALAGKAAEDVYAALRRLGGRRSRDRPPADREAELLVVEDPDGDVALYVWLDDSEEALRALAELDPRRLLRNRFWSGTAALVWDRAAHAWRLRAAEEERR